jgi:DNA topoisomerase I
MQAPDLPPSLVYVDDTMPGIRRRKRGKGYSFQRDDSLPVLPEGKARIAKLAIPPAYRNVWICAVPEGHLQATGYDDRGRKQYRYHPIWQSWRSQSKYAQLPAFGQVLGRLRRRIRRDLEGDAGELRFSLAALTMLIDRAYLRVGSDAYTRENKTFGATTLLSRHLKLDDDTIRLRYRAKGGKQVTQTLRDKRLHRILQDIDDLPGRHLFTYVTEDGEVRPVTSGQVNGYIAQAAGMALATAKTFRTWGGSLAAFEAARHAEGRLTVKTMCEAAAARLMNTPTISRTSYIHPSILQLAEIPPDDRLALLGGLKAEGDAALRADECRMLAFLSDAAS